MGVAPKPETEESEKGGFFARLLTPAPTEPAVVSAGDAVNPADVAKISAGKPKATEDRALPPETFGVTAALPQEPGKKGGLFGLFSGKSDRGRADVTTASLSSPGAFDDATGVDISPGAMIEPVKRQGLLGSVGTRPVTSEIAPGTVLPYGRVARICDLPKRAMGKRIAQFPERRPHHKLYDSVPGSTSPHTFFLTGFEDGCARQFTASLAVFGTIEMHEQLRYGLPAEVMPYSKTDKSYEKLKSKVCRVPRKKPCGAKRGKLENDTVFLSIYERFGSNARWSNLLLHEGRILAQDIKG